MTVIRRKEDAATLYKDGRIDPDSKLGAMIGFTSDLFDGWLWQHGRWIIVSFIEAKVKGRGDFGRLVRSLEAKGYDVGVPTPMAQMESILKKWGWKPNYIGDKKFGTVELWSKSGGAPHYIQEETPNLSRTTEEEEEAQREKVMRKYREMGKI